MPTAGLVYLLPLLPGGLLLPVKLLLSAGADPSLRCTSGTFPLYLAADRADVKVARLLIDAGADLNALRGAEKGGGTPLSKAVNRGHVEMVKLLLESGCDVERMEVNGVPPLTCAAMQGRRIS